MSKQSKALSEFYKKDYYATNYYYYIPVTNAPKSWQYVYVKEKKNEK